MSSHVLQYYTFISHRVRSPIASSRRAALIRSVHPVRSGRVVGSTRPDRTCPARDVTRVVSIDRPTRPDPTGRAPHPVHPPLDSAPCPPGPAALTNHVVVSVRAHGDPRTQRLSQHKRAPRRADLHVHEHNTHTCTHAHDMPMAAHTPRARYTKRNKRHTAQYAMASMSLSGGDERELAQCVAPEAASQLRQLPGDCGRAGEKEPRRRPRRNRFV